MSFPRKILLDIYVYVTHTIAVL